MMDFILKLMDFTDLRAVRRAGGGSEWPAPQPIHLRCRELTAIQPQLQRHSAAAVGRRGSERHRRGGPSEEQPR